jgi:hypothetical protein
MENIRTYGLKTQGDQKTVVCSQYQCTRRSQYRRTYDRGSVPDGGMAVGPTCHWGPSTTAALHDFIFHTAR